MRFNKKSIDEVLNEVVLCKEGWVHPGTGGDDEAGEGSSGSIIIEGRDIGYCGINDTVPGCSC